MDLIEEHIAALNARDIDAVLAAFHRDVEWAAPGGVVLHGPAQVESFLRAWWLAVPDLYAELGAHIAGETVAALEGTFTGTHRGRSERRRATFRPRAGTCASRTPPSSG